MLGQGIFDGFSGALSGVHEHHAWQGGLDDIAEQGDVGAAKDRGVDLALKGGEVPFRDGLGDLSVGPALLSEGDKK